MAVPPTSPLRVFPQAVNVDVQGFMPQGDLFQKTMAAFEQGSKLPLLQEQIKTEKMRNKLERDKIKLAEQYLVEDDARERAISVANLAEAQLKADPTFLAAKRDAEERKRKIDEANLTKIKRENLGEQFVDRGNPDGGTLAGENLNNGGTLVDASLNAADTGDKSADTTQTADVDEGTASEKSVPPPPVTDFTNFGTKMIKSPSEINVVEKVDPTIADSDVYIPKFNFRRSPEDIEVIQLPGPLGARNATPYAQQRAAQRLAEEFPPFAGARKDESAYNEKKRLRKLALEEKYRPTNSTIQLTDDNNQPILIDVVKVGDDVVDIVGAPRIDLDKLSKPQQNRDSEFTKMIGGSDYLRLKVNRDANIESYVNAATYLAEAGKSANLMDSRVAGLLPVSILNLFESDRAKAQNEARRVLQQQLRETLGGQFAFQEGERMLKTGFNLLFDDKTNIGLIREGAQRMLTMGREYDRAEGYYLNNGTLAGFSFNSGLVNNHPILSKFDDALEKISKDPGARQDAERRNEMERAKEKTLKLFTGRSPLGTRS